MHSELIRATRPVLTSLEDCDRWLDSQRLADPDQACAALLRLLGELGSTPPPAEICLSVLEKLRGPLRTALEERARRYAGRSLPLAPVENASFALGCDLWLAFSHAWRRLLDLAEQDQTLSLHHLLLSIRNLECHAGLIESYLAARREIPSDAWHGLHLAYGQAEATPKYIWLR